MEKKGKKQKTMKIPIVVSILLSIIFILVILYFTIKPEDIEKIKTIRIQYEFFILAFIFNFISWSFWGLRLKVLSNAVEPLIKISWWESIKIVMANLFLAGITPSMAGGEPVRIYLLNKDGLSFGCATASVLGERLLDAIFLLICVPFAFFIFRDKIDISYINIGITIGIIIFLITIFLFLYAIFRPQRVKGLLIWINEKLSRFSKKNEKKSRVISRINQEVDNFHCSMMVFLKKKKGVFLSAGFLTFIMWVFSWLIASMVLFGMGINHNIVYSMAAQVFLIIIIMMPTTPGSAGVTELGVAGLYSFVISNALVVYGHPLVGVLGFDQALLALTGIFVLFYKLMTYFVNIIVGAFFQYRIFKSVASFSMDIIKKQEVKIEKKV
ncbi:MAG: hypothetical protein BV457_01085 [Thermoplasmata archaeon M9B1D]|nr:MAG: hypothetical protein BV457_01085 [Thermoplasmata archaeon M9B1D]PNX51969.1 MAG: hypothetical protein BV456_01150 [Thermoplasmata archaeon M8B2D]